MAACSYSRRREDDNNRRQEAAAATVQMAAMAVVLLDSVSYPRRNVLGLLAIYGAGAVALEEEQQG
jgi:hypothetical protein